MSIKVKFSTIRIKKLDFGTYPSNLN